MPATSTCVRSVSASRLTKEAAPQQLIVIFSVTRRSEEHTSELQSQSNLVCRLLLEKKKHIHNPPYSELIAEAQPHTQRCATSTVHTPDSPVPNLHAPVSELARDGVPLSRTTCECDQ